MKSLLIAVIVVPLTWNCVLADESQTSADETAIRAAIDSYVKAFNRADAAAVAGHWNENGEFTTPSGQTLKGRDAIEREFVAYFAESKNSKIEILAPEIEFISPNAAIERGTARVVRPDAEPSESSYESVHVKQAGQWKLDSVREVTSVQPRSHHEPLQQLEWMIGEWIDADEHASVETKCEWTKNQNFLLRTFRVFIKDRIEVEGTQIIGWDPRLKTIRSWVFDSDGAFGVGSWTREGDEWTIRMLQVLHDGEQASAINMIKYVDDNTFTFRSVGREIDGELLPNIDEITVVRKP